MPLYGDKTFAVLGSAPVRTDGMEKVTGTARYTADMAVEGMLYGAGLSAGIPNGRIIRIDAEEARKLPGVACVLTMEDLPRPVSASSHRFITDRPRFAGDIVALAAAETKEAAEAALKAIRVEYEEYPAVMTIKEALAEGAVQVRDEYPGNIFKETHYQIRLGNVEEAFKKCDVILEREYETQIVEHAYIEPEAALAYRNPSDGLMTVHCCCQAPYYTRRYVAEILGVPVARVRVVQEIIGGTFGGKEDGMGMLAARCAYLSHVTHRPVKWVYRREESIERTGKRHPFLLRYKVGALKNGRILAWQGEQISNAGAYSNHTLYVNWRANVHSAGAYHIENVHTDTYGVFTNTPPSGAMRGYSSPQLIDAQEQLIDELAEVLNMRESDLRRINCLKEGSIAVTGAPVVNVTLPEIMEHVLQKTDYDHKREMYAYETGRFRRGIGMSIAHRGCGFGAESPDATGTMIIANEDGSVTVNCSLTENGQGLRTAFCMITAETLGVPYENVFFYGGDTQSIQDGGITAASRGTTAGSKSAKKAAEELNLIMRQNALELGFFNQDKCSDLPSEISVESISLKNGLFVCEAFPAYQVPFAHVCVSSLWSGRQMSAYAWYRPEAFDHVHKTGEGKAFGAYAFGCVVAEVQVDTVTGAVKVEKLTAAHDVGTAVHPELVRGQICGGLVMGQGFAAMEKVKMKDGRVATRNLDTYMIPTVLDVGELDVDIFESDEKYGTYGAKSIGEPATEVVAPAIANAIYHAVGCRTRRNPTVPEDVILGRR